MEDAAMSKIHLFHVIVSAVTYNFFAVLIVGSFQYGSWLARAAKTDVESPSCDLWLAKPYLFRNRHRSSTRKP